MKTIDRSMRRWQLEQLPLIPGYQRTYRLTVGGEVWSEGWSMSGVRRDVHRGLREQRRQAREAQAFPVSDKLVKKFGLDSPRSPFPLVAWPGCYPMFYIDAECGELCPDCANKLRDQVVDGDVFWEGPAMNCQECGRMIESAYGDPAAETEV